MLVQITHFFVIVLTMSIERERGREGKRDRNRGGGRERGG